MSQKISQDKSTFCNNVVMPSLYYGVIIIIVSAAIAMFIFAVSQLYPSFESRAENWIVGIMIIAGIFILRDIFRNVRKYIKKNQRRAMFKIIRCGTGFDLVIMVSPPDAGPDTPGARYYRYASWQIGNHQPEVSNKISRDRAMSYFSGIADGIGFEEPPSDIFPSLEVALQYVIRKRNEWGQKRLLELRIRSMKE